jgi:hypothetical protein
MRGAVEKEQGMDFFNPEMTYLRQAGKKKWV